MGERLRNLGRWLAERLCQDSRGIKKMNVALMVLRARDKYLVSRNSKAGWAHARLLNGYLPGETYAVGGALKCHDRAFVCSYQPPVSVAGRRDCRPQFGIIGFVREHASIR